MSDRRARKKTSWISRKTKFDTLDTYLPKKIDIVYVVGSHDVELFCLSLQSLLRNWKPKHASSIKVFVYDKDIEVVKNMINRTIFKQIRAKTISIQIIPRNHFSGDSYIDQRYEKLSAVNTSVADYIWFVDCDYFVVTAIVEDFFFSKGKIKVMCTRWVSNSAAFAYKFPSEQFLGRNIAKNYMVSGIYIFNRRVLLEAYRILNGTSLFGNISEYVILGEIASSYTDLYEFLSIDTSNLEITNNLQQDVTSGLLKLSFPNLSILRELRVVVFWSRWGELPLVMHALNYLPWMELESSWSYDLVFESSLNRWRNFERVTRNVESVVNFIRKRFAYSDGYIYPEIYFEMEAGEETFVKVTNSKGSESYMYSVDINGALQLIESYSEFETLRIPANETATKYLFRFRTKVEEPDSGRRLYAQV